MSTSSLRRQVKNIVRNYSEAEVKVREATSNDPWGPSTALMGEIADLTYNVTAFAEIMGMLWRRLNDHGRNWRHVYKALALAEYLVKTGSERVARQCRENVYAVQTLRDFQYVDRDGRDQGVNVREKAKQLVALLKDDARLQEERAQALRTKEKLAQASAVVASAPAPAPPAPMAPLPSGAPMEQAWPQSTGEEELQLQLALAMSKEEAQQQSPDGPAEDLQMQLALTLSKEEHDKEERLRRGDDLRLQMAIEESQRQNVGQAGSGEPSLMELADIFTTHSASGPPASNDPWGAPPPAPTPVRTTADPWGAPTPVRTTADPWGAPTPVGTTADPWGTGPVPGTPDPLSDSWDILGAQPTPPVPVDSWAPLPPATHQPAPTLDPWAPLSEPLSDTAPPAATQSYETLDAKADEDDFAEFDALRATPVTLESSAGEPDLLAGEVPVLKADGVKTPDLFDLSPIEAPSSKPIPAARKTPESFLGPNAALVDLDALVSSNVKASNPFLSTGGSTPSSGTNPFGAAPPTQSLSLNQLRASPVLPHGALPPSLGMPPPGAPPLIPAPSVMPTPVTVPVPLNGFTPHPAVPVTTTTNPFLL